MRFLSLVAASSYALAGCALIDASGDQHGTVPGGGLSFETNGIPNTSAVPKAAVIAELGNGPPLDVVVLDETGNVIKCINLGAGTFSVEALPQGMAPAGGWSLIATGDLAGDGVDGVDDIIAGTANRLDVLLENFMLRTLTPPEPTAPLALTTMGFTSGPRSIAIAYASNFYTVADPLGTAMTSANTGLTIMPGPSARLALVAGNVSTNSGDDELIATQHVPGQLLEFSNPTSVIQMVRNINNGTSAKALVVGDFGGSNELDVAFIGEPGVVGIMLGSPSGLQDSDIRLGQGIVGQDLQAADFDGDGRLDLAVLFTNQELVRTVKIFLNRGSGTFEDVDVGPVGNSVTSFAAGDLNGDGRADLVLVPGSQGGAGLMLSR